LAVLGELIRLAATLSRLLSDKGIEHFVSGSLALAVHARPRMTYDIDLVVVTSSMRLPEVFNEARTLGFVGEDRDLIANLRKLSFAQMRLGPMTLDIIVPVLPFHSQVAKRAVRTELAGESVPVATAEDLFVLTALWFRPKDVADLQVLAALGDSLDRAYIRERLHELLPAGDARLVQLATLLRGE
jgi:hypothetical protein